MRVNALNVGLAAAVCLTSLSAAADFDTAQNILGQARLAAADMKDAPSAAPMSAAYASDESQAHVGTMVLDANNNIGTVTKTFSNGRAEVNYGGWAGAAIRQASSLSISVSYIDGIRVNDRVLDANDNIGTVTKVFSNGRAQVNYGGWAGAAIKQASSLSVSVAYIDGLRVNDQVIDANNNIGTVTMLFLNERAQVYYGGWAGAAIRPARSLSRSVK